MPVNNNTPSPLPGVIPYGNDGLGAWPDQVPWKVDGNNNTVVFQGTSGDDVFKFFDNYVSFNGERYYYSDYDINPLNYDNWRVNTEAGKDRVTFSHSDSRRNVQINTGAGIDYVNASNAWLESLEINGGSESDFLVGSKKGDLIRGEGGNDEIHALEGDDNLVGGDGNDRIFGHEGSDYILGNSGDDHLEGGTGYDYYAGGAGADTFQDQFSSQGSEEPRYYGREDSSTQDDYYSSPAGNYFPHRTLVDTDHTNYGDGDYRYTETWNYW